jgi:hypothetical protein
MMRALPRSERLPVAIWLALAIVVWNGVYDVLLTRGVKEYLFRWALHEAGRGPLVPMSRIMEVTVRDAVWVSTLWAGIILLAGMVTIRLMRRQAKVM